MKRFLLFFLLLVTTRVEAASIEGFVASEPRAIKAMLDVAQLDPSDVLYDFGSGDGRIVIAAAEYGATAVGIELDPKLVELSRQKIKSANVGDRAQIIQGDLFRVSAHPASVVTLFFGQDAMDRIAPKLLRELRRGTRVISNGTFTKNLGVPFYTAHIGQVLCSRDGCHEAPLYLWIMGLK